MRDFYPIDREAFEAWLTDNRDSVVGRACAACDCPVVNLTGIRTQASRSVFQAAGPLSPSIR
jgi:hypothetical protein